MKKKIIISILTCFVFLGCKKANENDSINNYVIYSQKIAKIMDAKIKNMENLEIYPFYINDKLKEELVKNNYKDPSKVTILIYKYSEHGPLPYAFEHEKNLPDVLKGEKYKKAFFSIVLDDFFYQTSTELIPPTYAFYSYDLFVDKNFLKQPVICILEYEDTYPIVISFVTGENGSVITKSTIVFDTGFNQETLTSHLFWSDLELDEMYTLPLK